MSFQDKLKPVAQPAPGSGGFQQKLKPVSALGTSTFNVPEPANYRQNRLAQFQAEAAQAQEEARKANSFLGMTKAFGKGLLQAVAPSEVGLGKTIAGILYQGGKEDKALQETVAMGEDIKVKLLKTIREQEAQGKDTTRLKQAYNEQEKNVANTTRTSRDLVQLPTTQKAVGQLAGTALDVLTAGTYSKGARALPTGLLGKAPVSPVKTLATAAGAPELGTVVGQKAGGLFSVRGAGNIAKGASVGYASDVALGLQGERGKEREGAAAFIPGLGTALGASIPAVSETAQTVKNLRNPDVRISEKRLQGLKDLETKNGKIARVFEAADRKGYGDDVRRTLAETNLLNGAVDADGRISSDKALNNFNEFIAPYEGRVKEALTTEGRSIQLNQLADEAKAFIDNSTLSDRQKVELQKEIADNLDAFQQFRGRAVPVSAVHDTKVVLANANNYLNPSKNIVDKEAARFFKEIVEKNTSSLDVKRYNGELAKYYTVREALEAMDRAVVSGGRMGKYFSSLIGAGVGGLAGGPLGAIAGGEAGALARGSQLSRALGGNVKKGMEATPELLEALKPKAVGKASIPDVVLPKTRPPVADVVVPPPSSFSKGAIPVTKNTLPAAVMGSMVKANAVVKRTSDTNEVVLRDLAKKHNTDYDTLIKEVTTKLAKAPTWKKYVDSEAEKVVAGIPDTKVATAPVKSSQRIIEKTLKEEEGNLNNIKDIARNTIVPKTAEAKAEVLKRMDARKDVLRRKDQKPDDFLGYEGTTYNIKTPDGQIVETQVVTPYMTYGKNTEDFSRSVLGDDLFEQIKKETGLEPGLGHIYYEQLRTMSNAEKLSEKGQEITRQSFDYYSKLR